MDATTKAINYTSIVLGGLLGMATGFFIYQRTMARARQLEEEERAGLRQATARGESFGEFSDDPEGQSAAATILREEDYDDNVDFFGESEHDNVGGYRDDSPDDGQDVFRHGDGDDEDAIGLNSRPNQTDGSWR